MHARGVTLHTERLTLRRLTETDIPAVVAGLNDYAVSKWLTVVPFPYAAADAREFLAHLSTDPALDGFGIHSPDGLAGVIGISDSLGYWLARAHWGRGYATEAAAALVGHYFSTATAGDRLGSGYFEGNAGSCNVLTKLGFVAEGEERVKSRAQGADVMLKKVVLTRSAWVARHGN